ncbi:MAG: hypothetical protein GQ574_05375 [Crocinitomix sp.]|nr:hypothetical protein [Crocinitomix sp.]
MKFLVHFRRNEERVFTPEVLKYEQERMAVLMREKILTQVFMDKTMAHIWMELHLDNRDELLDIVKSFPMCQHLFYEVHELA